MQIRRCHRALCVAAMAMAAFLTRADDSSTQAPPPAATSSQTTTNKAEMKKQAEANAKAQKEAEKKAKAEAEAKKKADAKAEKGNKGQAATNAPAAKPGPAFKPLERPPSPVSAEKDQRLAELLRKYKADEITPNEYFKERAKILAEP
jgi:hypothetical protein